MAFLEGFTKRRSKYHNRKTICDGIVFGSLAEANRYTVLKHFQREGIIEGLEVHPRFGCVVHGVKVCEYVADFRYLKDGAWVVEDVKGVKTAVYQLKKKLMRACHQLEIREVGA